MEKYTKKSTARILKEVLKHQSSASGRTTFDQAYVILMTAWDMDGDIETKASGETIFKIWRDGEVVKIMTWDSGGWNMKVGDWNWDIIYKDVLESIIKEKLYKRPKIGKRAAAKLAKEKEEAAKRAALKAKKEEAAQKALKDIEQLKKKKSSLYMKIWDWKKKGKDTTELEQEYDRVVNSLKKAI